MYLNRMFVFFPFSLAVGSVLQKELLRTPWGKQTQTLQNPGTLGAAGATWVWGFLTSWAAMARVGPGAQQ